VTNGASKRVQQVFSPGEQVLTKTGKPFIIEEIGEERIRFRLLSSDSRMSLKQSRLARVIDNFEEIRNSDNFERAVNDVLKRFGDSDSANEPYLYGLAQEFLKRQVATAPKAEGPFKSVPRRDGISGLQKGERRFWVVSPNVTDNPKTIALWKKAINDHHAAFMGWGPKEMKNRLGFRFANHISKGDVILIARRVKGNAEVVGFGVVAEQKLRKELRGFSPPDKKWLHGSIRKLLPFVSASTSPAGVPIWSAVNHTASLCQLHPDRNADHRKVCEWIGKALGLSTRRNGKQSLTSKPKVAKTRVRSKPHVDPAQFDFSQRSAKSVRIAKKLEAALVRDFKEWLRDRGHVVDQLVYGRLLCDAHEKDRNNLIEAKSSSKREYIRMAVGQLLDYAFLGKKKFGTPHMAILLPKKPEAEMLTWLEGLKIKVIWKQRKTFVDNAQGLFT
jgi:hypothetical protein